MRMPDDTYIIQKYHVAEVSRAVGLFSTARTIHSGAPLVGGIVPNVP